MDKICLIRQPSGLGDIFFTLKIAEYYKNLGYEIWWPVISPFAWIKDYIDGYNFYDKGNSDYNSPLNYDDKFFEIYNKREPIFSENLIYLPLQMSSALVKSEDSVMNSKYKLIGLDYTDWSDYFKFKRKSDKENELFYNVLNLKDDDKYCFISKNYGSPPNFMTHNIKYDNNLKVIELSFIEGFTLFDWCKVIEKATEIHTVDSSINYIIDKLNLSTENIFLHILPKIRGTAKHLFKTKYKHIYEY